MFFFIMHGDLMKNSTHIHSLYHKNGIYLISQDAL